MSKRIVKRRPCPFCTDGVLVPGGGTCQPCNGIGEQGDQYMTQLGFAPVDKNMAKMDADLAKTKAETQNIGNEPKNDEK